MQRILERLDRLEQANRQLSEEVHALRTELAAYQAKPPGETQSASAPVEEQVAVHEQRIEELAQTKVEASQKFPIRVTGMALVNAFLNSRHTTGADNPTAAALYAGRAAGGATIRQTIIGLDYRGPQSLWGAKVSGSVYMDFFGGSGEPYEEAFRIRTARINFDWNSRSIMVGQETPLISPRAPNSLARVGLSPLTGAGNLWAWQPQVRFEQRFPWGERTGVRAQIALSEASDESTSISGQYATLPSTSRPAIEGRLELSHRIDDERRIQVAPGFHYSSTHVAGNSIPSNIFSFDAFVNPWRKLEFTGMFFAGRNVSMFATPTPGYVYGWPYGGRAVRAHGGWGQASFLATERLSFNLFGGSFAPRYADLWSGSVGVNSSWAANVMYRLAPNVIVALEGLQLRTDYVRTGTRLNNHYDLAVAYLF